ncbi:dTDP-4-dehydrorhamnose reductase [Mycobacterium sp. MYCO198283]|uniref:dTDP-4-dehydrorhamnose reductase n=1 Tax=Mycobacterium sp. MYCO198283 TaxID=2883505 RepID=UPI001E2B93BF|nr:dTDP-4-dehydrorhamnose reductase [Mycobacterium sp. MYCO198283]MCG5431632.1 dTDP-4-dehydrorhamnose reductase [Mycobacterium sp. MYCO198283]
MSPRIVITGAAGLVGRTLAAHARAAGREVAALSHAEWDVADPAAGFDRVRAGDVVVNCAAWAQVDAAEADPAGAQRVNGDGPGHVARVCAAAGAGLVQLSTDYVFDGSAGRPYDVDDEPAPISAYGRTKLAGERAALAALPDTRVVRTAWLYEGRDGGDFVAVMRRKAAGGDAVDVVADQVGSPTYVVDLVGALLQIVDETLPGPVLHAAGAGATSRYELARAVFELVGADPARVRPVDSSAHPRPAPRPPYSALSSAGSARAGLRPLRSWRAALAEALAAAGHGM